MWLYCHITVDLLVGFHVDDSDDRAITIKQRSHIKSLFVSMLYRILNLRYCRHLRIINCVGIKLFFLAINLDAVSSFNIFSTLVYVCRYNVLLF